MRVISTCLAALLLAGMVSAQAPPRVTETVDVGYVVVPFVIRDRGGKPIENLRERDVTLLVEGKPVDIDMFAKVGDAPVSYTILLDGSGSMELSGKMDGARLAIQELLSRHSEGDDYALYVFSEGEVREVVPFTSRPSEIMTAVNAVEPYGKTAFFDALAMMPHKSLLGNNGSRAIILLTDGFDNASVLTSDELANLIGGVDVPVYPMGLRPEMAAHPAARQTTDALLDLDVLRQIAAGSGGRLAVVSQPESLVEAIRVIQQELRAQYLIGFSPTGRGPVRYRTIALQVPGRARSVHVRGGYRGTEPPLQGRSDAGK
jgi:Ca-activated chloride channel family protein